MRYLAIFLLLFSANLFAQNPPPLPSCSGLATAGCTNNEYLSGSLGECGAYCSGGVCAVGIVGMPTGNNFPPPVCAGTFNIVYACASNCSCPEGYRFNVIIDANGVRTGSCVLDEPTTPPDEDCPESAKVYDPVTGTLVCPGSGDGSSSASSQNCVVPGDYDGDCIPDDSSSAASSGAASSVAPSSGANSSGNDGNNDSGGSASSSGSASGGDGGSGSGPGTGTGSGPGTGTGTTPGGSSAGSNTSSGSNNSWTPNSGYGNWIPVSEGSNCPNKYEDANGQWWCAGSTGTGSSAGAGQCDPTSKDYLSCISQQQTPSSGGSASSACTVDSPNYVECSGKLGDGQSKLTELGEKFSEDIDTQKDDFENAIDDDLTNFERDGVPFSDAVNFFKNRIRGFLPSPSSCIPPVFEFWGNNYELDCYLFDVLKQAIGWVLAILTAINVFQIAIRPVDR